MPSLIRRALAILQSEGITGVGRRIRDIVTHFCWIHLFVFAAAAEPLPPKEKSVSQSHKQPGIGLPSKCARPLEFKIIQRTDEREIDELTAIDPWNISKAATLKQLDRGELCFTASLDNRIVGFARVVVGDGFKDNYLGRYFHLAPSEAYYSRVFCVREYRGLGVVPQLLAHIAAYVEEHYGKHHHLAIVRSGNVSMHRALTKIGWKPVGRVGFLELHTFRAHYLWGRKAFPATATRFFLQDTTEASESKAVHGGTADHRTVPSARTDCQCQETDASPLHVEWCDARHAIDAALSALPESKDWPGVFKLLVDRRDSRNRVALVLDREDPVAVVLLRSRGIGRSELALNWIVPGFLFPVRPGYTWKALEVLDVPIRVGWWRFSEPPPSGSHVHELRAEPVHRIACSQDFNAFWKQTHNLSFVRQARQRCKSFTLSSNPEGGAEWVIRNWAAKWGVDKTCPKEVDDRVAVATLLEASGRHHTEVLYDRDLPIAGASAVLHGDCVVASVIYRRPEYNHHGVGTFIIDATFQWAVRSGYRTIDLGGGPDYKDRWAPVDGHKYTFTIAPCWKYIGAKLIHSVEEHTRVRFPGRVKKAG